jgi:hypothetical protein
MVGRKGGAGWVHLVCAPPASALHARCWASSCAIEEADCGGHYSLLAPLAMRHLLTQKLIDPCPTEYCGYIIFIMPLIFSFSFRVGLGRSPRLACLPAVFS